MRSAEPDPPYPADFTSAAPSDYDIACRAYELYQERGAGPGHDLEDWLRAERELRSSRPS